jgi:hypothetical protein
MAKLTQRQIRQLNGILHAAQAAQDYLMKDRVLIAIRDTMATTSLHFQLPRGGVGYEVEKFIGSPLAQLPSATTMLRDFIVENQ